MPGGKFKVQCRSTFKVVASAGLFGYLFIMPTVGEQLYRGREAQKLAIHQVADMTKIRGDHIRALEDGNYSVFSAPVYIRGFVRTYSNLLKLDTPRILEQLGQELAESGHVDPTLVITPPTLLDRTMFQLSKFSRRLVWPAVGAVVLVAVAALGYVAWNHYQTVDPTIGIGDGLYQAPANTGETLPLPASP
jgi:cytoskeletal protein RodZ